MLAGTALAELARLQDGQDIVDDPDRVVLPGHSLDELLTRKHSLDLRERIGQPLSPDLTRALPQTLGILRLTRLELFGHLLHIIGQLDNDGANLFLFPGQILI